MQARPLNILFLADVTHPANALRDHIQAYVQHSRHRWVVLSPISMPRCDALDLDKFDAVAIHYSIFISHERMLPEWFAEKIRNFKGLKFQFIQDEYRRVSQISQAMVDLGIHLLFTLVAPESVDKAYAHPGLAKVRKVSVLAGYVPEHLVNYKPVPINDRKYDIIYRSREVPYWLGKLGQDKKHMAEGVLARAAKYGLRVNISVREEKRIYGEQWLEFMQSGRCVLGTEGGASLWDFDGTAEIKTNAYLEQNPGASFEEVYDAVLAPYEGNLMYNTLSPRLFEAAALKTPMVLFRGWYNGVVEEDKHYIVLEKDFSNFDDVVKKISDTAFLETLAERTYQDLVASGKYSKQRHVSFVDDTITETIGQHDAIQAHIASRTGFEAPLAAVRYVANTTKYQQYLRGIMGLLWFTRLLLQKVTEQWRQPGLKGTQRIVFIFRILWKYMRIYATHYYVRLYDMAKPIWSYRR